MKRLIYILIMLVGVGFATAADAQPTTRDIRAGLVVCEAGDMLYSTIGHAAIHMECEELGLDLVYSYEGEDVSHQWWTFLRGQLKMGMFAVPADMFKDGYRTDGRSVTEYPLLLTDRQKTELWRALDERVKQGNQLPYDYFSRGCAITVVEIIHEALTAADGASISYAAWPERLRKETRRELVRDAIEHAPWQEFILYMLIGSIGDKDCLPEEKLIVPQDLADIWSTASVNGKPLLGEAVTLVESAQQVSPTLFPPMAAAGALLLLLLAGPALRLMKKQRAAAAMSYIANGLIVCLGGMLGIVMTWLICFSHLPCTEWNWLLVPFNILPIAAWPWRRYWAKPYACLIGAWAAAMLFWPHTLVDPAQTAFALIYAAALALSAGKTEGITDKQKKVQKKKI